MQLRWDIAGFFWMQGLGVLIELSMARLFRVRENTALRGSAMRALRLTWAVAWMSFTMPLIAVPFAELGYWHLVPPRFPLHRLL